MCSILIDFPVKMKGLVICIMSSEIGEKPVSLPSIVKIRQELDQLVEDNTKAKLLTILSDIAEKYNLSHNELVNRYMTVETSTGHKPVSELCMAKVANGRQCSRRHRKGEDFCGSHLASQPFGTIAGHSSQKERVIVLRKEG